METTKLKKFAQSARVTLIEQVATKLNFVLGEESLARRENPIAVKKLEDLARQQSEQEVIERIAYIWFNRFCALRFMDMNRYNRRLVVSPATGDIQPEVLALAKSGDLDDKVVPEESREQILNLLNGKAPSRNPEAEVYRLLLVAYCNQWHESMPFLFQRIDDYTELLMPDDLLSSSSVLADMRDAMPEEACEDVEVIGWLYQFYISDKKDDVFAGLKKNKKVTPENIPAATQLFTPHWIVRYLVENSLGRLWLLNHPESKLADHMEYYIKPAEGNDDTDYLKVESPKDLKICDPACGSGHMLTYAFDLLYAIYEEQGYDAVEIPTLILTHNLYGIEIDERAGELAAFALTMKARARHRRFFSTGIRPNICVLEPISFDDDELDEYMNFIGRDLFTTDLEKTLRQFDEVDNFGSLIRPALTDVAETLERLHAADVSGQLFLGNTHQKVLKLLKQADYLSPQYHVVVANPPYMGSGGMNTKLSTWAKKKYPNSKSDLFAMFIERSLDLVRDQGLVAMITMHSWMFLSSFKEFREELIDQITITSMAHLGARAFDSIGGEVVQTTAFVIKKQNDLDYQGDYLRLVNGNSEFQKKNMILEVSEKLKLNNLYRASANDFKKIPGSPIAYWVSVNLRDSFIEHPSFSEYSETRIGLITGNNDYYIRQWSEVAVENIGFNYNRAESRHSKIKWFPQSKGGEFRRWYGNNYSVVNWQNDGKELQSTMHSSGKRVLAHNFNLDKIFSEGITWTKISSGVLAARYQPLGFLFNDASANAFPIRKEYLPQLLALLCSKLPSSFLKAMNPTLNFLPGNIASLPISALIIKNKDVKSNVDALVETTKRDWDAYESSWDFTTLPLLDKQHRKPALKETYQQLRAQWQQMTDDMQRLEEENNRIFIDAYGLQDELTPEVPLKEITLTCNPYYRYGDDKTGDELEALLLADTMRELISYAVGCMFGRYSLDKPGLILANQGDTINQYLEQIPEPSFTPDKNNVIPILDDGWFSDDIVERFRKFIKVAFGEAQYESNMQFIELALGKNDKPRDIRDYFLKDFYNDHIKRYKKRPIYWLFSSGNFNALIYMHRYQPDTVSVVLNDYLREFRTKLNAYKDQLSAIKISGSQSQSEKTKAQKKLDITAKMITEMEEYERDVLYPLATQQVEIDLDDGVKVNYPKFGKALKKVTGLSS
jgi:type II restriction/modification system DNA methylase subunit YeeA